MLINMPNKDIRTNGYVIRRTNYGEADRIINIITPVGKMSAIARGVRKEKSKLAGNIELFSLIDFSILFSNNEMGILTGAKMLRYYGNILKSFDKMELAGLVLKKISIASDSSDNSEYYRIVEQCLIALDGDVDLKIIEMWFLLNLAKAMGEEVNLYRGPDGSRLEPGNWYNYDIIEGCFVADIDGIYNADTIKLLRILSSSNINVIMRIKGIDKILDTSLKLVRIMTRITR